MQLYLHCNTCRSKVTLSSKAKSRRQLAIEWGVWFWVKCPHCVATNQYHVNSVEAESTTDGALPGAVVGGLLGLLGGPIGLIVGGALGGAVSNSSDKQEANNFNNNYINQ